MFELKDYLELVDDTGRAIRDDKRGSIHVGTNNILNRLNIPLGHWLKVTNEFKHWFKGPVGTLEELTRYCEHLNKRRVANSTSCKYWPN